MNLEYPLTIAGYMEEADMTYLAGAASRSKRIVEIGSWMGRSACALAANTSGVVTCVDTFSGDLTGLSLPLNTDFFAEFIKNTTPYPNIVTVRTDSLHAAQLLCAAAMTFDMIFIDASHDFESVRADLEAWMPLLVPGGILCGHDYHAQYPGVAEAVDSMVGKTRLIDRIWTTEHGE